MPDYFPQNYQGYSVKIKPVGFWRNLFPWEAPYYVGDKIAIEFSFIKNYDNDGDFHLGSLKHLVLCEEYPDGGIKMIHLSKLSGVNDDNFTFRITSRMMASSGQFSVYADSTKHFFNTEIIHRDVRRHEILFMVLGALLALLFSGVIWIISLVL